MRVPIASLPGHLPLRVIDRIHDSKSRMRSRKQSGRRPRNEASEKFNQQFFSPRRCLQASSISKS